METIKERASDYFHELLHNGKDISHAIGANKAYIKGATEQRKLDIEKAYHALEKVVAKDILEELRKVMEE